MLRNYLTIALRHLRRHPGYAAINVVGLAVGMACCLLILLFVRDELSYDRFHDNAERVYRIVSDWGDFSVPATSWPVVSRLEDDFPQIEAHARLLQTDGLVRYGDESFVEEHLFAANPAVFDVFSFPLRQGDPATALSRPFTTVITPEIAEKYFGDADPMGQTLRVDNQYDLEVTGVLEPIPAASHVHPDFFLSWSTLDAALDYSEAMADNWGANGIYTYLLLPENADPTTLEAQFPDFVDRHAGSDWNGATLLLQPLTDIHLHSHHNSEIEPNGNIAYVYVFSIIAAFVLLIAGINFVNLSTARSAERAKEVGVRKSMGAQRGQLVRQFLAESVVLAVLALVLAVALVALALPAFRALSGKALDVGVLTDGFTLAAFAATTLVVGVLAGAFPAFVLSRFQPVRVLRGRLRQGRGGGWLRKGLVTFQFAVSVVLIVGTAVVYTQLDYLRSARLGFDQERVVMVPMQGGDDVHLPRYDAFRQALAQQPGVEAVSASSEGLPSELLNGTGIAFADAGVPDDSLQGLRLVAVSHDFFDALGAEMVAGRGFSRELPTDSGAFVVNEAALDLLAQDLPQPLRAPADALGKQLRGWSEWPPRGPLIGVADNFNMATLHESVEPILFMLQPDWFSHYVVRVQPGDLDATLGALRSTWAQFYPDWPFDYRFVDQAFDAQYRAEERLGQIFGIFAGLAILIACLGLFGLAAFTAQQRTKEIGVRKVLGASVTQIVALLSKEFVALVGLAFVIAAPVAYLAMDRWLSDFAYRTDLSAFLFLGAGGIALAIAVLTVSYHALRAALADPVQSLRYE
ncbi:MAG: FtsX-like permease family protein [Bacteroidetes bacterium]|jgi:putative ABC transport system permease protein|nr:FtsX-like permease family protein [Bacteroidota bacterium]